jgi:hypothetical protein
MEYSVAILGQHGVDDIASTYEGSTKALDEYEAVVAGNPEVECRGATMPDTSLSGHMFSFLDKTGAMALRLPEDRRDEFIATYETGLAEQHGRVMKEFVVVPEPLLQDTTSLQGGST